MDEAGDNRNKLSTVIADRRMIRAFESTALPDGLVDDLLDTARRAPSAGNCQATTFVVLDRPRLTARYWDTTLPEPRRSSFRWQGLLDAPALILVMTEPGRYPERYREPDKVASGRSTLDDWPVPYWWVDAGAVIQNLLLLITDSGLGACLFGPFDHEPLLAREFDLPAAQRTVATIAVGYGRPDEPGRSANRPRRSRAEVIVRPD
jgi:nitroreductase